MDKTMTRPTSILTQAALLGAIAGMRSMSAPLVLSTYWQQVPNPPTLPFPFALLTTPQINTILKAAAVGEMGMDKTPVVPARTDPLPLLGRIGIGAGVGASLYLANEDSPIVGGLVGAVAALFSTFVLYYLRRFIGEKLHVPDTLTALAEDALVVGSGWWFLNE
jgi:uncharacterized membrane protein